VINKRSNPRRRKSAKIRTSPRKTKQQKQNIEKLENRTNNSRPAFGGARSFAPQLLLVRFFTCWRFCAFRCVARVVRMFADFRRRGVEALV
jgi:hypothetical protein